MIPPELRLLLDDLRCDVDWLLLGGRRFYRRHWRDLVRAHRWLFIVGCNNSGTSLLKTLLARTGCASTMRYEGQRHTRMLPRTVNPKRSKRVWMEYAERLALPSEGRERAAPRLVHDWMRALDEPVRELVVEKTPANVLRMEWLQAVFPDCRFVGLVRNGYAVAEGIRRKVGTPVERGARHWDAVNRRMIESSSAVRHYLELRYEDLVEQPDATAQRLARFLGIDADRVGEAMHGQFRFSTVLGTRELALRNLNEESIRRLSGQDLRIIRENAGAMLEHFGYAEPLAQAGLSAAAE